MYSTLIRFLYDRCGYQILPSLSVFVRVSSCVCMCVCMYGRTYPSLSSTCHVFCIATAAVKPLEPISPSHLRSDHLLPSPICSWLSPLQDSCVPSRHFAPPILCSHSRSKTGLRELGELYSVCPQQSNSYRKWVVSWFPIDSFLSHFSLYVIRCIQLIFTLCPFINRLPPLL